MENLTLNFEYRNDTCVWNKIIFPNKPLVEILTCAVDGNHQGMVTMLYQTFCAGEFVKPPAGLGYITYSGAHQQWTVPVAIAGLLYREMEIVYTVHR